MLFKYSSDKGFGRNDIFDNFINSFSRKDIDFNYIKKDFADAQNIWNAPSSSITISALKDKITGLTSEMEQYFKVTEHGAASISVGLLNTAISAVAGIAVTAVIGALITGLDNLLNRSKKLQEAAAIANDNYVNAQSELSSIDTQLSNTNIRMDELNSKEKLSFVEQSELDKLREATKELEIQKSLAENKVSREAKTASDATIKAYENLYGGKKISQQKVSEYRSNAQWSGNNAILTSDEHDISALLAALKQFESLKEEALNDNNIQKADEIQEAHISTITDQIWQEIETLQGYKQTLDSIPEEWRTKQQNKILEDINSGIEYAWKDLDPSGWKDLQVSSFMGTDEYTKSKDSLLELAKANEETGITVEDITQKFPKLTRACKSANIEISDLASEVNAKAFEKKLNPEGVADSLNVNGKDIRSWMKTLSQNELNLLYSIDADTSSLTLDAFKNELVKTKKEASSTSLSDLLSDTDNEGFTKKVDSYQQSLSVLKDALDKVKSNELSDSDLIDLFQQFPELASGTDNLETKLKNLMDTAGKDIFKTIDDSISALNEQGIDPSQLITFRDILLQTHEKAKETSSALNSSPLFDEWNLAQQSANSGDKYVQMADGLEKAKQLFDQGLVGTDDFKSYAAMISPTGMDDPANFEENYGKIKRYFNTDSNQGVLNFLDDLSTKTDESGKALASFDEESGKWAFNIKDMEDASKQMGIGIEPLMSMFGRLEDYGISNNFVSSIEEGTQHVTDLYSQLAKEEEILKELQNPGQYETIDSNGNTSFTAGNQTAIDSTQEKINGLKGDIQETLGFMDELVNRSAEDYSTEVSSAKDTINKLAEQRKQVLDDGWTTELLQQFYYRFKDILVLVIKTYSSETQGSNLSKSMML